MGEEVIYILSKNFSIFSIATVWKVQPLFMAVWHVFPQCHFKQAKNKYGILYFCSENSYLVKQHKFLFFFFLDKTSIAPGTDSSTSTMHVKGLCRVRECCQQNPVLHDAVVPQRQAGKAAGGQGAAPSSAGQRWTILRIFSLESTEL